MKNLNCPECNGTNLHHGKIEVFHRAKESGPTKIVSVDGEGFVSHRGDFDGSNPSDRRGGITILFRCENCPAVSQLRFIQHKGETLFDHIVLSNVEGSP